MSLKNEIARLFFAVTALILVALITSPQEKEQSLTENEEAHIESFAEKKVKKGTKSRRAS